MDVGVISRSGERNRFESLVSYWRTPGRPVLGQVFEERGPGWSPTNRVSLPNWFSHLLPEGQLRRVVAKAAGVKAQREFHLLARIGGDDLPGAIRVSGADRPLHGEQDQDETPSGSDPGDFVVKFSLAGVQPKFSVRARDEKGITLPAAGQTGRFIVKLPDGRPDFAGVPEAELAALELGRAVGIDVPGLDLVDVAAIRGLPPWAAAHTGRALLVQRFDRKGSDDRVHAEELAQVLDVSAGDERFKYRSLNFETVARVTAALCGSGSVRDVIDRLVLNVLIGNGDAHAKNWAYVYRDGQRPQLSPLYDVVPTVLYLPADDLGLKLAGSRSFADVTVRSFDRLAAVSGWSVAEGRSAASDAVGRVIDRWPLLADHLPGSVAGRLTTRRDGLPLVRAG